ncbi:hypothetical protein H4R26_004515 [Coemansia thaxteri]|uniref:Rhodanese domain-containing protein n=1 Tax=Coemansia thaxteri TaxID=2663907 RepID=A0A9W8BH70_9FUNG|nr:hypothetical protein H4R26_004515 [Coemansia thaxteri]
MDQPYPESSEDGYHTVSFYSFFKLDKDQLPHLRNKMQKEWADGLKIVGRIYLCEQGINAQLSIPTDNTRGLRAWLEAHHTFSGRIPKFNWAIEHRRAFKALHVRVRPLVSAGEPLRLETLSQEPEYLAPAAWENELRNAQDYGDKPLLIDMRNNYEFRIGRFQGAICPDVDTFREEMDVVRTLCKEREDKNAPIYMYCTGGIRCSIAGAILKSEGYSNVKTLQGGVIAYGKHVRSRTESATSSLYLGKNFTFDKRLGEEVTADVLAKCDQCGGPCDSFTNCANKSCNLLFIQCEVCSQKHRQTCGDSDCIERAQMSHDELIKNRLPPRWNYHMRVRPDKVFGKDGVARPEHQKHVDTRCLSA